VPGTIVPLPPPFDSIAADEDHAHRDAETSSVMLMGGFRRFEHMVWSRVREGQDVVVVGTTPPPPEVFEGEAPWVVVRLEGRGGHGSWGPLEEARRRIEALLGERSMPRPQALGRMSTSSRALGDELSGSTVETAMVRAANRLADRFPHRSALVIDGLDEADPATIDALGDIVERSPWMRLPLVIGVREVPEAGPLCMLLGAVDSPLLGGGGPVPADDFGWENLDMDAALVMRAAAVMGNVFDVDHVARLLELSRSAVLFQLQRVFDRGAPVVDRGAGRFSLSEAARRVLVRQTLPSLVEQWTQQLGEIYVESMVVAVGELEEDESLMLAEGEDEAEEYDADDETISYELSFEPAGEDRLAAVESSWASEDAAPRPGATAGTVTSTLPEPPSLPVAPPLPELSSAAGSSRPPDETGAEAGGTTGAAESSALPVQVVEQYMESLREVAIQGDSHRALLIASQASQLLERQPATRERNVLWARVLTMAARVQWRGVGRGPALTLQCALQTLDQAIGLLMPKPPIDQQVEIAQLMAGVCYDLGDDRSLRRALDVLGEASRALNSKGDMIRAARLLNDQAAVYLRAGDAARANLLLQKSRNIFDGMGGFRPNSPTIIEERAETEHLLARLPLHAQLRPGREDDAFAAALEHARAAAEGYRRLGGRVEVARVRETMGRLEIARGRYDKAAKHLTAALKVSEQVGDVTGQARCTAAMSDLHLKAGRPFEAAKSLEASVSFNTDKGSPLGVEDNRAMFDRLEEVLADSGDGPPATPELRELMASIAPLLEHAEASLSRNLEGLEPGASGQGRAATA